MSTDTDVASLVARIFSDIRDEMDSIVNSADIQGLAAALECAAPGLETSAGQGGQQQQHERGEFTDVAETPILQLHGRTYSTEVGYYDDPLPNPEYKLPEVLPDIDLDQQHSRIGTAEAIPVMLFRVQEQGYSGGEEHQQPVQPCSTSRRSLVALPAVSPRAVPDCNAPFAEGPCRTLTTESEIDADAQGPMLVMPGAHCGAAAGSPSAHDHIQPDLPITGLQAVDAGNRRFLCPPMRLSPADVVTIEELMGSPRSIAAALAAQAQHSRDSTVAGLERTSTAPTLTTTLAADDAIDWGTSGEEVSVKVATSHFSHGDLWGKPVTGSKQQILASSTMADSSSCGTEPQQGHSRGSINNAQPCAAVKPADLNTAISRSVQGHPGARQNPRSITAAAQPPDSSSSSSDGGRSNVPLASGENSRIFTSHAAPATARAVTVAAAVDGDSSSPVKTWPRSKSAPREQTAAVRHIQRLQHGATRAVVAAAPTKPLQYRAHKTASDSLPQDAFARLYRLGVHQQFKRIQPRPSVIITQAKLTEEDWKRVSQRLFDGAHQREERLASKRRLSEKRTAMLTSSVTPHAAQAAAGTTAARDLALAPVAFHQRQHALLLKRAQWARQKRPDDEEELKECTFHPHINSSSKTLHRSISELHRWDNRRQHQVAVQRVDKLSHEFDGYTFAPVINDSSRRIALESYAAAPDPARPWTSSPTHINAPNIKPYTPPRSVRKAMEQELGQEHCRQLSLSSRHELPSPAQAASPGGRSQCTPQGLGETCLALAVQEAGSTALDSPWQVEDCQGQELVIRQLHLGHSESGRAAASSKLLSSHTAAHGPQVEMTPSMSATVGAASVLAPTAAALLNQQLSLPEDAVVLYIPEGEEVSSTNPTAHLQARSSSGTDVEKTFGSRTSSAGQAPAVPAVTVGDSCATYNMSPQVMLPPIRTAVSAQLTAVTAAVSAQSTAATATAGPAVKDPGLLEGPVSPACVPWQRASGMVDSADCTPTARHAFTKQGASGTLSRKHLQMGHLFRGDSAGQMTSATHRKEGGTAYTLVTAAPKNSPLAKTAAAALLNQRQQSPSLPAVEQAALGLPGTATHERMTAWLQPQPSATADHSGSRGLTAAAYYKTCSTHQGMSTSNAAGCDSSSGSYSLAYANAKAAAAAAAATGCVTACSGNDAADGCGAVSGYSMPSMAHDRRHYSTVQLLNALQRSSSMGSGMQPATPAQLQQPAAPFQHGSSFPLSTGQLGGMPLHFFRTTSAPGSAASLNGQVSMLQQILADKEEGMLNSTQSVPYELVVAPVPSYGWGFESAAP